MYAVQMDRAAVKRRAAGHAAANKRALEAARDEGPPAADVAFSQALDMIDLAPDMEDPLREQGVARARAEWAKLRAWAASRDRG